MKVGDLVRLYDSVRRNGSAAGRFGLIVALDKYNNPVLNLDGMVKAFHLTQISEVINASR
jgi:hypothetical protein|tara:strand:+ start:2127 stop:2306 length:180 start_codon:yes stop_codon:yes gene_type:complete